MWEYAQAAAQQAGLKQQQLQLVAADVQSMPFEESMFDAAVVTLVSLGLYPLVAVCCEFVNRWWSPATSQALQEAQPERSVTQWAVLCSPAVPHAVWFWTLLHCHWG
eukprot:GHUV01021827.1.p3 GENE.GHUV01021827.1~~GHUV01021827.1.p3  ORF type:complete len:107 (-),score=40.88 GHUV01021827.1:1435-1755(-)